MEQKDLENILDWSLKWLEKEENSRRIACLIAGILDEVEEIRRSFLGSSLR